MIKPIRNGLIAIFGLILFYFVVMGISSKSWTATVSQFKDLWYWIIILSFGFGIQIGLYTKLKNKISLLRQSYVGQAKTLTATSAGTSGVAMIACCAHHLSDVLPIIGLSGAALFLTQYQIPLIVLGITMNFFGIVYMLKTIRKIKSSAIPSMHHV